jgi:selenocysteine lyase/cysteine desulfurase
MTPELAAWRQHFPITERHAYLDHAAVGALPRESVAALAAAGQMQADQASKAYQGFETMVEDLRGTFAALIGADVEEIGLAKNTSMGLSTVAAGLPWRRGDSVVLSAVEFPCNVFPWTALAERGVEVRSVPAPAGRVLADDLMAACDATTRVVALSYVQFSNGFRADVDTLGELCRARKILLVVDAMQAVGALAVDVHRSPIDVLATASNKWLLGPFGCGWLYVRRELIEQIQPLVFGVYTMTPRTTYLDHSLTLRSTARRFDDGVPNFLGLAGLQPSLNLLRTVGPAVIEARVLALTDRLAEGLTARGYTVLSPREKPGERSSIVTFRHPAHDSAKLQARLTEAGVVVSLREGAIRVSPHFYNSEDEIDRLLEALPGRSVR